MEERECLCIMERMMAEEMKWQSFHLETETLLCSPWRGCVSVSGTAPQLKHEVTWREKKKGLKANKASSPTRSEAQREEAVGADDK